MDTCYPSDETSIQDKEISTTVPWRPEMMDVWERNAHIAPLVYFMHAVAPAIVAEPVL